MEFMEEISRLQSWRFGADGFVLWCRGGTKPSVFDLLKKGQWDKRIFAG
jgi:hypothetical protein